MSIYQFVLNIMVRQSSLVWGVIVALIIGAGAGYLFADVGSGDLGTNATSTPSTTSTAAITLNKNMRKLWLDHTALTRLYVVETAGAGRGASDTAARLLKNQEDIGNAIKPYYGNEAGASSRHF